MAETSEAVQESVRTKFAAFADGLSDEEWTCFNEMAEKALTEGDVQGFSNTDIAWSPSWAVPVSTAYRRYR
jgi:hypothetical protein